MNAADQESGPLYGIGTVARLTRLKPDTLRAWERRYGLGPNKKSASGRRLYSQTDLEHLQIISGLVSQGFRIGEIAALEHKTLTAMQHQRTQEPYSRSKEESLRALFIGASLCNWLDQHPSSMAGLEPTFERQALTQIAQAGATTGRRFDLLVVETKLLDRTAAVQINNLRQAHSGSQTLVLYKQARPGAIALCEGSPVQFAQLPLRTALFASEMKKLRSLLDIQRGAGTMASLAKPQPRIFEDAQLEYASAGTSRLGCNCPAHLAPLVRAIAEFERYSAECAVDNWQDATTHACVFAYSNQARWLMERALQVAMDEGQS